MGKYLIKLLLILLLILPLTIFSQSEGSFGFRRYSNTTNLNNTSVSNSNTSASRSAYVHSNGLYYVWDGNSWEREHDIDTLSFSNPTLSVSLYGDGVPAKTVNLSGLMSSLTADNGLNKSSATNVQLGGTLLSNTTISGSTLYSLTVSGNHTNNNGLFLVTQSAATGVAIRASATTGNALVGTSSSSGAGLQASSSSGFAISGQSTSGVGGTISSTSNIGLQVSSDATYAGRFQGATSTNNAYTKPILVRGLNTSVPSANELGTGIEFETNTTNLVTIRTMGSVGYRWEDATDASRDSRFEVSTVNAGSESRKLAIGSAGNTRLDFYGDGTFTGTPTYYSAWDTDGNFIEVSAASVGVNIYNSDGTQDDADRYFTIDSSRTFAMGQFNSFPASTWGRGFYYDPSNNDGIRILNKDGSNTSTTKVELDPFGITIHSDFSNSDATHTFSGLSESANQVLSVDRTSDTYGAISIAEVTNTNEEIVALVQNGKGTTPNVSMYLGDGYSSSQYAKYTERAWGVQSHVTSGSFDWIQVLLPDTGTDTTGNNLNFYNRKYYWVNTVPSPTVGDSSVHIWVGNGTTTTPLFVPFSTITAGAPNIYNSNGTTTDNTRTVTITESIQWVGTADLGVDAYPFQIHSTGNEPLIQLWKGNTDSAYIYQSDVEYVFGSSTRMVIWPQSDLTIIADSTAIQGVADVTKVRRLMGLAASGYLKTIDGDALTAGTILKSDGTDFTTGDWLSTYSSATQSTSAWAATNAASDVNAAIVPKGTGAFILDVPDGGTGGGNSRGADAIDLQTTRDAATQVASGTYSGIFAGRRNTVSGTAAVILGGADNIVTGSGSFIIGGYTGTSVGGAHLVSGSNSGILGGVQDTVSGNNAFAMAAQSVASGTYSSTTGALSRAYLTGQRAHATTTFVTDNPGFSQVSTLVASRAVTGTSQVELFLDGASAQAILLGTNRSWNFSIQIVGICSTVGNGVGITAGDTWTSWHVGGIKRLNTTTSLVGTVQAPATAQSDAGMSTSTITIDADDSTEALRIRVTPPSTAGTTTVIRWVAYISLAESAY